MSIEECACFRLFSLVCVLQVFEAMSACLSRAIKAGVECKHSGTANCDDKSYVRFLGTLNVGL